MISVIIPTVNEEENISSVIRFTQIQPLVNEVNVVDDKSFYKTVADRIPIIEGIKEIIAELKGRGLLIGIISDSYDCNTNHIKNKLDMDFSLSNELEFSESIYTGEIKNSFFVIRSS